MKQKACELHALCKYLQLQMNWSNTGAISFLLPGCQYFCQTIFAVKAEKQNNTRAF